MSSKYPGGIISKTAPTPSGPYADSTAPGVWTLEQQAYWQKLGQWPTAGNVNPNAFIENLFSTYLYTGNGSTQTITNGIDLSTNGGLVWGKVRSTTGTHELTDTVRGANNALNSNNTDAQSNSDVTAFTSSGYALGYVSGNENFNGRTYVSWTFRKQPKFFDVVTYTGNGTAGRTVAHDLGSVPGCIIVKQTSASGQDWMVYHRSLATNDYILLNSTGAASTYPYISSPTSTTFTVESAAPVNSNGGTYVAYLFAHNAGGFGLSGTDNVISCGSFSASMGSLVSLGYEPQWVLIKRTDSVDDWLLFDNMRGLTMGDDSLLNPNTSGAENNSPGNNYINPQPTGFTQIGFGSGTYIYIAIRRGPMAVPTLGTSVFTPDLYTGNGTTQSVTSGSPPLDLVWIKGRTGSNNPRLYDRLRGATKSLAPDSTAAETTRADGLTAFTQTGFTVGSFGNENESGVSIIAWDFRRAPGFFDEVCYTGTGVDLTVNHNLGVVPEWVIIKNRSRAGINWSGAYFANASEYYDLRINQDIGRSLNTMGPLGPTLISNSATTFGVYGGSTLVNYSGDTYVAYLFATCAGVSKVGSYTGTGAAQTINCGFTSGARFVLIKRTDSTGDWYVWDSARGIIPSNDPYLLLNTSTNEVTGTDYVDTTSVGFDITSTAPSAINANGGTFIFLAIA